MSTEVQLVALTWFLYVFDACLFLSPFEAMLYQRADGKWEIGFGVTDFTFAGRAPFVRGLFRPDLPLFRLKWNVNEAAPPGAVRDPMNCARLLRPVAPFVWMAACALYVVLPLGLLSPLGWPWALAAVFLLYGSLVVALFIVALCRSQIALSASGFAALAFECLACPPFGVGLVRRLTLAHSLNTEWPEIASRLLPPDQQDIITLRQRELLDALLAEEVPGSDAALRLEGIRRELAPGVPD